MTNTPNASVAVALSAALAAAEPKTTDDLDNSKPTFVDNDADTEKEDVEDNPFKGLLDDTSEDEDDQKDDFGTVEIFQEKCLNCSHLVAFADKAYSKCHFSKGNAQCPAQSLRITVRVPVEDIGRQFKSAKLSNDNARLSRLYAKLSTFPDWYQQRVTEYLKEEKIA